MLTLSDGERVLRVFYPRTSLIFPVFYPGKVNKTNMLQGITMTQIDRLLGIMKRLRDPENGCPWDKEQTFATIAPYTLEETYEVLDAIAREDFDDLRGELGDLLFQVVFYAQMAGRGPLCI
jgi:NTP pyrophosphatase (non-canonical NTP hydrolase)